MESRAGDWSLYFSSPAQPALNWVRQDQEILRSAQGIQSDRSTLAY